MTLLPLGSATVSCADGKEFPPVPGGGPGRRELCKGVIYIDVVPLVVPTWGPESMAMAVLLLGGITVNCAERKEFPLVPGGSPRRRKWCGGVGSRCHPSASLWKPELIAIAVLPLSGVTAGQKSSHWCQE